MTSDLVGGLDHFSFFHWLGIIIPTDELTLFRRVVLLPNRVKSHHLPIFAGKTIIEICPVSRRHLARSPAAVWEPGAAGLEGRTVNYQLFLFVMSMWHLVQEMGRGSCYERIGITINSLLPSVSCEEKDPARNLSHTQMDVILCWEPAKTAKASRVLYASAVCLLGHV